jgi:hypothetical protein
MNNKYFYPQSVEFIFRMCLRTNGEYFFIQQLTGQPNENVESALFWDIAQLGVAIPDQRFGTTFKGQEIQDLLTLEDGADKQSSRIKKIQDLLTLEDGTDRPSWKVSTELRLYAE